jgi:Outer membrane protein beta-barrel domain
MRRVALIAIALLVAASTAAAQDWRGYAGGGLTITVQGAERVGTSPDLPTSGASGTAVGVAAEAGVFVADRVAIGGELNWPARYTAVQETDYLRPFQYESRHRDLTIDGLVRFNPWTRQTLRLALVGGWGAVQETTKQRRRDSTSPLPTSPPVFGPWVVLPDLSRWTTEAIFGAELEIRPRPGLSIVPGLRFRVVDRNDAAGSLGWALGLDSFVVRPGIGVRVAF